MPLCGCTCTIAHTYAVVRLCSRALVLLCLYSCACTNAQSHTLVQSCPCALVPAQLHTLMQLCFRALVLSCVCVCTHAYIHAVVRLCGCTLAHSCPCTMMQGRQGSEESPAIPACMMVMPSRTLPTCFPCRTSQEPRGAGRPVRHG